MADASLHLNDQEFQDFLSKHQKELTFVEFYADWCPHCQVMGPVMESFARAYKPQKVHVIKIDTDQYQDSAQAYQIELLPTTVILRGGEELERFVGERELSSLETLAKKYLATT